ILPGWMSDAEIAEFRTRCKELSGPMPWLVLKLDSIKVKDRLSRLIDLVDGVFISRKELALSTSPALVPMLTKEIIEFCILRSKTVITASDMLASMRHKPSPTRAEISDIANSVYDGSDAVVLSEDIFLGDYYHQALQTMDRAIIDAEEGSIQEINWIRKKPEIKSEYDAISYAAFQSAELLNAKAFVCLTEAGKTAISLASFRPKIPIIAVTFKKHVTDNLALVRGVDCLFFENSLNFDEVLPKVNAFLKQESWLKTGDRIIFVSVTLSSIAQKASNLFTVQRIQ
nr:hypothetical protein [Oligoflexales bacterium]